VWYLSAFTGTRYVYSWRDGEAKLTSVAGYTDIMVYLQDWLPITVLTRLNVEHHVTTKPKSQFAVVLNILLKFN